jgi:hypothetical protein
MIFLAVTALTIIQPGFWFAPMMRKNRQRIEWDNMHAASGAEPLREQAAVPAAGTGDAAPTSYWPMGTQGAGQQRYDAVPQSHGPQPYEPYGGAGTGAGAAPQWR